MSSPAVAFLPPGQTDFADWNEAMGKGWIVDPCEVLWSAGSQTWRKGAPVTFGGYDGIENGIFPNSWNG